MASMPNDFEGLLTSEQAGELLDALLAAELDELSQEDPSTSSTTEPSEVPQKLVNLLLMSSGHDELTDHAIIESIASVDIDVSRYIANIDWTAWVESLVSMESVGIRNPAL